MAPRVAINDYLYEGRLFMNRTLFMTFFVLVLTGILVVRLVDLQILEHSHFKTLSRDNQVKLEALPPTRGLIFDRNGVRLADNLPTYSLELIPERVEDIESTLAELARVIDISPSDLRRFDKLRKQRRGFQSVPLRFRLNDEEVAHFSVNRHLFPGVEIKARLTRHYPAGELTAHVLGYVGRINVEELGRLDQSDYSGTSHIGKTGIEKTYEDVLHGQVGLQRVETNALGRTLRVLERTPPLPGNNLKLTLDIGLQAEATAALEGHNGSVVAIDTRTGGVLAMASTPVYDPNLFVNGIDHATFRQLNESPDKPLFNRSLHGRYPPGSTVKPFVALAGLHYDHVGIHQRSFCPGHFSLPGREHKYRDWKKQGHGWVDVDAAIAESCDVYFYKLAVNLGVDEMHDFMSPFGFGQPTGLDVVGERSGILPSSAWKRAVYDQPWYPGETLITAIGQGFSLATPLQLAHATAVLANRGVVHTPHLVEGATSGEAPPVIEGIESDDWDTIITSMVNVVHGPRGTARAIGEDAEYRIAGKTGTAQVFTIKQDEEYEKDKVAKKLRDHALFVAFAPADDPQIAIAVVVENGGSGSGTAAPIARRVLDSYLLQGVL